MKNVIMMKKSLNKAALRFTPGAWAKLVFLRDISDAEVGGFGISDDNDLLLVKDIALVKQEVTEVSVSFDDESVADLFEDMVAAGKRPEQFARIWIHTHPSISPLPSITDEDTFLRVFGKCDWSVMSIIAKDSAAYTRLKFSTGPGGQFEIPAQVDYTCPFEGSGFKLWQKQYADNVRQQHIDKLSFKLGGSDPVFGKEPDNLCCGDDILRAVEEMDPFERDCLLEELARRSDIYSEFGLESEVF